MTKDIYEAVIKCEVVKRELDEILECLQVLKEELGIQDD